MNKSIDKLINQLSRLPGIGDKTAQRLAYYIIDLDSDRVRALSESIIDAKEKSKFCSICNNITDKDPCEICDDDTRERSIICVVEYPKDVISIEKAGKYRGLYHVLHGNILSSDDGDVRLAQLIARIRDNDIKEVIIAFNPSVKSEASVVYLSKLLKPFGIKVTKIGYGIPVGGDMDFFDSDTINIALENRREL